jgi:hypothetical protein
MPALRPSRFADILLSRPVGVIAGAVTLSILLGCMSISFGPGCLERHVGIEDGVSTFRGKVHVPPESEVDVYYPLAFACNPNLELSDAFDHCDIVYQCSSGFRVRNTSRFSATARWKARGQRAVPPEAPTLAAPPSTPPAPDHPADADKLPPPQPVPVNK